MHRLLELDMPAGKAEFPAPSSLVSYGIVAAIIGWLAFSIDWEFVATLDFSDLWPYRVALMKGFGVTLATSVIAICLGLVLGTLLAILQQMPSRPVRVVATVYVEIARNLPLAVSLFWVHFALPYLTGITTTTLQSGLIAIVFQASGYLADIARAGIQAVPRGQYEASYALGISTWTKWVRIILPQALKVTIPPLANVSISFFKATSILSVLSVGELMSVGLRVSESNFRPIETLTFCGLVYILLGTLFSRATQRLEAFSQENVRRRTSAEGQA